MAVKEELAVATLLAVDRSDASEPQKVCGVVKREGFLKGR